MIEAALFVNTFAVDEHESHLLIKEMDACQSCQQRPCIAICPAAVFLWEDNQLIVRYSGCLECAACRFVCPYNNIDWNYPRGGYGVIINKG